MATVVHASRDVISNSEGGWVFTPAAKPARNMQPVVLARVARAKLRRVASQPVTHSLTVTFIGTESGCTAFRTRIRNLYDGTIGLLTVPEFGTISQCCFMGEPRFSEQTACEPTDLGAKQWWYDVDLEIMEL